MMSDSHIIKYIEYEIRNDNENRIITEDRKNALYNVNNNENDIQECNEQLKIISDKY